MRIDDMSSPKIKKETGARGVLPTASKPLCGENPAKFHRGNFTKSISQLCFRSMALHTRTHFLGSKLRTLRKTHGLTLEELSNRCIQLDAARAPSISYLSMIESGKRVPSNEVLALLG